MWLLVGGDSELGAAAYQFLKARGDAVTATTRRRKRVAADRPWLDLAGSLADWEPPAGLRGACVFAGVARLAACASDPTGSAHINVTQTLAVIERLLARAVPVVFLSTNQVFDGRIANVPPDAAACPVSEYGRQKARTEAALREHMKRGAPISILRLAKVVSPDMPLIHAWVDALAAGQPIRAFHDMTMAPTPIGLATAAIAALLDEGMQGIFQLTGGSDVTYVQVGRFVADWLRADPALVTAMSARDAGLPEGATPQHTTLDSNLVRKRYGIAVPGPWEVVEQVIAARQKQAPA